MNKNWLFFLLLSVSFKSFSAEPLKNLLLNPPTYPPYKESNTAEEIAFATLAPIFWEMKFSNSSIHDPVINQSPEKLVNNNFLKSIRFLTHTVGKYLYPAGIVSKFFYHRYPEALNTSNLSIFQKIKLFPPFVGYQLAGAVASTLFPNSIGLFVANPFNLVSKSIMYLYNLPYQQVEQETMQKVTEASKNLKDTIDMFHERSLKFKFITDPEKFHDQIIAKIEQDNPNVTAVSPATYQQYAEKIQKENEIANKILLQQWIDRRTYEDEGKRQEIETEFEAKIEKISTLITTIIENPSVIKTTSNLTAGYSKYCSTILTDIEKAYKTLDDAIIEANKKRARLKALFPKVYGLTDKHPLATHFLLNASAAAVCIGLAKSGAFTSSLGKVAVFSAGLLCMSVGNPSRNPEVEANLTTVTQALESLKPQANR